MPDNQILRSESIRDILTRPPHRMILWGNGILFALTLIAILLSWLIKYPDVITTKALVTSEIPPQKEYASGLGKIDSILVKDGQKVSAGQPLAILQNPTRLHDVWQLQLILDTLQLHIDKLAFPYDQIPLLKLGEISPAYAVFENDYVNYLLNKTLNPYAGRILADQLSTEELKLRIESTRNQILIDEKKFELANKEFIRNEKLFENRVISLDEFEKRKLKFLEEEKNLKNSDIALSRLKQALNDIRKNSNETRINHQMETTHLFKKVIRSYVQLQEAIQSWELKYMLKARINGEVSFVNLWTKYQSVNAGELMFTIIPSGEHHYFAKLKAPIQNSGKLKLQQQVKINLFNYPETEYGTLNGHITAISAIPNEDGFYQLKVSLDQKLVTSYQIEIPYKNEMSGTAEIITEDLRLTERLFFQLKKVIRK